MPQKSPTVSVQFRDFSKRTELGSHYHNWVMLFLFYSESRGPGHW
jgi:hypothetical protein